MHAWGLNFRVVGGMNRPCVPFCMPLHGAILTCMRVFVFILGFPRVAPAFVSVFLAPMVAIPSAAAVVEVSLIHALGRILYLFI
jgi:hypothetical protein